MAEETEKRDEENFEESEIEEKKHEESEFEKEAEEDSDEENSKTEQSNIDDFSIRNLSDFINASEETKAPVLEKIANAVNPTQLERQIWNFSQTGNREDEEEKRISYGAQQSAYAPEGEQRSGTGSQYSVESGPDYSNIIRDKSMEETRRFVERNRPGNEWSNQGNISDIEKPMKIENEEIRETQRYMNKGDYKT